MSALAGKKEYMQVLDKTFFSFTYGGDCIGLAAAEACIPKLEYEKVPDHLWHIGSILKEGFNELAINNNLDEFMSCIGYPCRTIISFDGKGKYDELEIKSFFQQELIRRGVLWTAYHAISWSHNKEDIEFTLKAFDETMQIFKKILSGNKPLRSFY